MAGAGHVTSCSPLIGQVFTPESAAEHPDAVHQLGVEFARAGADVTQTFSFWCHEDKLPKGCKFSVNIPPHFFIFFLFKLMLGNPRLVVG